MQFTLSEIVDGIAAAHKAPGTEDPVKMARHIKETAYFLRADQVGICELPPYSVYSHSMATGEPVELEHKYAIAVLIDHKLPYKSDITTVDVSFISIKRIIKKVLELTRENGEILLLFKPQFELPKEEVKNKGIVREIYLHRKSLKDMIRFLGGLQILIEAITFSRIKGTKGNIEFWIYLRNSINPTKSNLNYDKIIVDVVNAAHKFFH